MSKPNNPKKTPEQIKEEASARMRAMNAKRKKDAGNIKGDEPAAETPATEPAATEEPAPSTDRIRLDGPVVNLEVPDITKETPFSAEPIIHGHANIGGGHTDEPATPAPGTETPTGDQPTTEPGSHGNPTGGDNPHSAPPLTGDQPPGPSVGPNGEILGEQPGTMPITKSQVRQTFETFCAMFNYMVGNYAPFVTKLKLPNEIEHLRMEQAERFKEIAESLSVQRVESLKLSQEEIEMLRDSAEAVLAESGKALTPAQMLMVVGLQILISKLGIIWQIRNQNKELAGQIRNEIAVIVAQNNGLQATIVTMQGKIDELEKEKANRQTA